MERELIEVNHLRRRRRAGTVDVDDVVIPEEAAADVPEDRLSWAVKICYGLPQIAMSPLTLLLAIHANVYYEKMGASLSSIAFGTAFARSFDVMSDPGMGWLSDNSTRFSLGRRRPYMLMGMPIYAVAFVLLMYPPIGSGASLWYMIFYVIFYLGDTIAGVPYSSLGPELSDNPAERTTAFFIAKAYAGVGTLLGAVAPEITRVILVAGKGLAEGEEESPEEDRITTRRSFLIVGVLFATVYVISMLVVCVVCKERGGRQESNAGEGSLGENGSKGSSRAASAGRVTAGRVTAVAATEQADGDAGDGEGDGKVDVVGDVDGTAANDSRGSAAPSGPEDVSIPLVPSILRAFNCAPFTPLVIAWVMDAVAVALIASSFPFYITYTVRPELADPPRDPDTVMALCFAALFIAALLGMPVWAFLARRFGRFRVWQSANVLNAMTNALFIFVNEGDPNFAIGAAFINGLPLGAGALTDSILSDVISYDTFLNSSRAEGAFAVFSSLVPKLASVPASAVPLSIIYALGFSPTIDGVAQPQVAGVRHAIRFFFVAMPLALTIMSYFVKRRYPIKTEQLNERIREGISLHDRGLPARDPLTGRVVEILEIPAAERDLAHTLDHFSQSQLRVLAETGSVRAIVRAVRVQLGCGILATGLFASITISLVNKLEDPVISLIPILSVICAGASTCFTCFSALRVQAAGRLTKMAAY
jgi:Na+/melibiose symporter-like transporter